MATVTLDLSKAVPLPQAPVQLDMSKAQPLPQASQAEPEGFWHSLGATLGISPEAAQTQSDEFRAHPIQKLIEAAGGPAYSVAKAVGGQVSKSASELSQAKSAIDKGDFEGGQQHATAAVPIIGPAIVRAGQQVDQGDTAGAAGSAVGAAAQMFGPEAMQSGAQAVSRVPELLAASKAKLYPTSQSLAMDVSAARNLSKALIVDPAGVNNFVKAATDEAGTIVGYAKDKGIPINSKVDFANAAKQTADAVQQHFDSILEPNKDLQVAVPGSYEGVRIGEGQRATLEQVNKRIDAISSELKSNVRKPLSSQVSSANASDADLISEKQALTNVLHKYLSQATGLSPEEIAGVRQQAGKLRTIADESQLSANRDLTAAGKQEMGTTTSAVGTKAGLIDRALQTVQGGPEIIGNRQVKNALQKVTPRSLNLPQPNP